MRNIHKNTVKAIIRKTGEWTGYIAPDNVAAYHVIRGWSIGMPVSFTSLAQMEEVIANFAYYNCNSSELGYRVRFWSE